MLDRKRERMVGRLSFGDVDDAFHGALKNAVDVYIADAIDVKIQAAKSVEVLEKPDRVGVVIDPAAWAWWLGTALCPYRKVVEISPAVLHYVAFRSDRTC